METTTKASGINTSLNINIMEPSVEGMYGTRKSGGYIYNQRNFAGFYSPAIVHKFSYLMSCRL